MRNKDENMLEIIRYLNNQMSDQDRYAFERKMQADPFLADAVEGYEQLGVDEMKEELAALTTRFQGRHRKIIPVWLRVAAGIALLLGVGSLFLITSDNEKGEYLSQQTEIPVERVEENKELEVPNLNLSKKAEPELPKEIKEVLSDEGKVVSEKGEEELSEVESRQFAVAKMQKSDSGVNIRSNQQVDLSLKYDGDAVGAEKPLYGKLTPPKTVDGSGTGEVMEIKIRGMESKQRDTAWIAFRGRVVDANGMPLSGAQVSHSKISQLNHSQNKMESAILTDNEGNFEIEAPKQGAVLEISSIGFKDKLAISKSDSMGDVILEEEVYALNEQAEINDAEGQYQAKNSKTKRSEIATRNQATPKIGIEKLVKRLEREFQYPDVGKKSLVTIKLEVFVHPDGAVDSVKWEQEWDAELTRRINLYLSQQEWQVSTINEMPVKSSCLLTFQLKGDR